MTIVIILGWLALVVIGAAALLAYLDSYLSPTPETGVCTCRHDSGCSSDCAIHVPAPRVLPFAPKARHVPRAARQEDPEEWWYIGS